jgi:hypothetical protein
MKNSDQSKKKKSRAELQDEFDAAISRSDVAQAKAAKAQAEAARAGAEAERAIDEAIRKGEALQERIRAEKADAEACAAGPNFDRHSCSMHSNPRVLLVKALGMLGSDHVGERAAAALMAEKQRAKLGKTWNELIVREHDDEDEDLDDDEDDLDDDDEDLDDDEET